MSWYRPGIAPVESGDPNTEGAERRFAAGGLSKGGGTSKGGGKNWKVSAMQGVFAVMISYDLHVGVKFYGKWLKNGNFCESLACQITARAALLLGTPQDADKTAKVSLL